MLIMKKCQEILIDIKRSKHKGNHMNCEKCNAIVTPGHEIGSMCPRCNKKFSEIKEKRLRKRRERIATKLLSSILSRREIDLSNIDLLIEKSLNISNRLINAVGDY